MTSGPNNPKRPNERSLAKSLGALFALTGGLMLSSASATNVAADSDSGKTNETELVIYDVHEDEFSVHCDCPDATYRKKEDTAELCKHQIGLAEAGLI